MSFPEALDFDRIMLATLQGVTKAVREWLSGLPITEEPLMNRLTAEFTRRRRQCDVGAAVPMTMSSQVAFLHRQGDDQSDSYGADLAITVDVATLRFRKTALFQLKVSDAFSVRLERRQLERATMLPIIHDRSFILVAEKARACNRVNLAAAALDLFRNGADTATCNCADWLTLGQWLIRWMSCEVGGIGSIDDPSGIEPLLQRFVVEPDQDWEHPWPEAEGTIEYPEGLRPAKVWLAMFFTPMETTGAVKI